MSLKMTHSANEKNMQRDSGDNTNILIKKFKSVLRTWSRRNMIFYC